MVQILDFPIHSIHFHFSLSSRKGEVSQLRETFSPKLPSRMTPAKFDVQNFRTFTVYFRHAKILLRYVNIILPLLYLVIYVPVFPPLERVWD